MFSYLASIRQVLCLTAILVFCALPVTAQDIDPPATSSSTFATALVDGTIQATTSKFMLGFNWDTDPSADFKQALSANTMHLTRLSWSMVSPSRRVKDELVMPAVEYFDSGNKSIENRFVGMGMFYEPGAVTSGTVMMAGSQYANGCSFGFRTVDSRGTVTSSTLHVGYSSYELHTTSFAPTTSALVLADPWPDDQMAKQGHESLRDRLDLTELGAPSHSMNGRHLYASINLRLLPGSPGGSPNDDIIKIAVPYYTTLTGGTKYYINFLRTPQLTTPTASFITLPDGRGYAFDTLAYTTATTSVQYFTVKRYMLSGVTSSSVTISALFILDGDIQVYSNSPLVDPNNLIDPATIKRLGLEVSYLGKANVAVNWVSIQTPHARDLFFGVYDDFIKSAMDEAIRVTAQYNATNASIHLFRFYLLDECGANLWRALRYGSSLTGGLAACETGSSVPTGPTNYTYAYLGQQFYHDTRLKEFWLGSTDAGTQSALPFFWNANYGKYLGYKSGYGLGLATPAQPGQYECFFYGKKANGDNVDLVELNASTSPTPANTNIAYYRMPEHDAEYEASLSQGAYFNTMMENEWTLYKDYYKNSSFLYDASHPWWSNLWEWSNWKPKVDGGVVSNNWRQLTGEELRFAVWNVLLLGTKGLLYFKSTSSSDLVLNNDYHVALANSTEATISMASFPSTHAYLSSDALGIDFLESTQNSYHVHDDAQFERCFSTTSETITLPDITNLYGVSADRFYLGRKTHRLELEKIDNRIRSVDDELMHLQLKAWYGKGFREWNSYASTASWSAFTSYVDVTGATTRQVGRADTYGNPIYESRDSSFFDITYLENSTNGSIVIGVQNRRTDPVILVSTATSTSAGTKFMTTASTISTPSGLREYRFYTTEEFDRLVTTGTFDAFGGQYAQLGCRELRLPCQYHEANNGYALLRFQELGGGIDTTIGQDKALTVRLKPGEGKLLRVTVLHDAATANGSLDYSNQRKMICARDVSTPDTTDFRYHMVYHTTISGSKPPRNGVYYRRSKPMKLDGTNDENIVWESPLLLSGSVQNTTATVTSATMECAYPSLVVRDGKVYVVYACTSASFLVSGRQTAIVENIFTADATTQTVGSGRSIAIASGSTLSVWGTPVVNASAGGQYYAWSDLYRGIVAGYRTTTATGTLLATTSYSWAFGQDHPPSGSTTNCIHPSVNTYSRIEWVTTANQEDECALVWEENANIYYARLKYDVGSGTMLHYGLPDLTGPVTMTTGYPDSYGHNLIAQLSDANCTGTNHLPVVYRGLETWNVGAGLSPMLWQLGGYKALAHRDIVFWEGNQGSQSFSRLYMRRLEIFDHATQGVTPVYDRWKVASLGSMWYYLKGVSNNYYFPLHRPDLAQGLYNPRTVASSSIHIESANLSNDAFVTDFIMGSNPGSGSIYQMRLNLFSPFLSQPNGIFFSFWGHDLPYITKSGTNSHLSARAFLRASASPDMRLNRRVFEENSGGALPNPMVTSSQLFYKGINVDVAYPYAGYQNACAKYSVSRIQWSPDGVAPASDVVFRIDPDTASGSPNLPFLTTFPDTLKSDPFIVGSLSTVSFDAVGGDTSFVQMDIVRLSDGARQRVTLHPSTDSTVTSLTLTLTGGGNQPYRVEFLKKDTSAYYVEDWLLTQDTSGGLPRVAEGRGQVVNLGGGVESGGPGLQMVVYPNPAGNHVSVSVYQQSAEGEHVRGRRSLVVEVVNMLGIAVGSYTAEVGNVLIIDVQRLPAGMYHVRAHTVGGSEQASSLFVIQR